MFAIRCAADGSGFVTYDEFTDIIRHKLKKGPKAIKTSQLKALWWCAAAVPYMSALPMWMPGGTHNG